MLGQRVDCEMLERYKMVAKKKKEIVQASLGPLNSCPSAHLCLGPNVLVTTVILSSGC